MSLINFIRSARLAVMSVTLMVGALTASAQAVPSPVAPAASATTAAGANGNLSSPKGR